MEQSPLFLEALEIFKSGQSKFSRQKQANADKWKELQNKARGVNK